MIDDDIDDEDLDDDIDDDVSNQGVNDGEGDAVVVELGPSKSQRKRDRQALRNRARELVALPDKALERIPMNDAVREHLMLARTFKRGALKREIKYLAGLLSEDEENTAAAALDDINDEHRTQVTNFHQVERWRDRLIAGDDAVLDEVADQAEDLDRQHLMQLARNARREQSRGEAPRSSRALHRYLTTAVGA
ncbi:MAG: ribosome-associated protein [Gammaproteobacteria bacterium]|jgi:ribosome-associated protein